MKRVKFNRNFPTVECQNFLQHCLAIMLECPTQ